MDQYHYSRIEHHLNSKGCRFMKINPDFISPCGLYCGNKVFRGVVKCNQCNSKLDLD